MNKSDLKNRMVVELRNRDICLVIDDRITDEDGYELLDKYYDDLCHHSTTDLDIVEVYDKVSTLMGLIDDGERDSIWRRQERDIHWLIDDLRDFGSVKDNIAILARLDEIQQRVEEIQGN